ncbi:MAG: helix-turn-helix domain-containing protein [Trichormus sp.]
MDVFQGLLEPCDRKTYGEKLRAAAEKLGKTVRTVQRLVKNYQQDGLSAIVETQRKDKLKCDRHNLRLLTKCTNCETPFPIPAEWVQGECPHCFLPFATMAKRQKHG